VRKMKQDLEKNAHGTTPVFIAVIKKYHLISHYIHSLYYINKNIPKASYTCFTSGLPHLTSKSVENMQGVKYMASSNA
jgi:hypothetical protein